MRAVLIFEVNCLCYAHSDYEKQQQGMVLMCVNIAGLTMAHACMHPWIEIEMPHEMPQNGFQGERTFTKFAERIPRGRHLPLQNVCSARASNIGTIAKKNEHSTSFHKTAIDIGLTWGTIKKVRGPKRQTYL